MTQLINDFYCSYPREAFGNARLWHFGGPSTGAVREDVCRADSRRNTAAHLGPHLCQWCVECKVVEDLPDLPERGGLEQEHRESWSE